MKNADTDLTPRQLADLEALAALPDDQIDTTDIPEALDWSSPVRHTFFKPGEKHTGGPADYSERGFETLIYNALTGFGDDDGESDSRSDGALRERPPVYGPGWLPGERTEYDREHCVDLIQLFGFLKTTQPEVADALSPNADNPARRQFLARLKREVGRRGVIDVLRNGVRHRQHSIELFYGSPTPGNDEAAKLYSLNRFSVTRQLRYSNSNARLALDLALFVNGLPIATFELKNSLTKQTVADAVEQYKRDRNPREDLFREGRCAVHFAVDESEVRFCAKLDGDKSEFLPFNKGQDDGGAGNPVNSSGLKTDYLWREILTRESLTDIIENYAQKVDGRQIWPRYHQLDVVRKLLSHAREKGAGQKCLIQHSAGSGKSNSIAWLARQLIEPNRADGRTVFDSVIVVTDRRVLDRQINDTIRLFTQVSATVGHAESADELRRMIIGGKKIIITTVQKFPFIADAMGADHRDRDFAIIIDEAHSSQGGRAATAMNRALSGAGDSNNDDDDDTFEDKINRIIEGRRMLPNASYFAFTATPKNKTLELFGAPSPQPDGTVKHLPFHTYSMKQAIQEGFILDTLGNYTTIDSYFNLVKKIDDDPEFDSKRAQRKLRRYVEGHEVAIRSKAEIIVDHFHESVFKPGKIGGQARAMLVTDGVERAIDYYGAIGDCIAERGYPYRPIVAFSGERDYKGATVSEATINGFPSAHIPERIRQNPYRILICADKFQTGYDEPLLHTMYVDKTLAGVRAVQTLSRLNRAHPNKTDTFALDFMNDSDSIRDAFSDYYRTTILADETDPDKLHDLKAALDARQIYSQAQVDRLVKAFLGGESRAALDPILDACVAPYLELDEAGQVDFKGSAKTFNRLYAFLSQILPYGNREWEKLSIFLQFLTPKLPAPMEDDLALGILETIDMDSYRAEKQMARQLALEDEDAEIDPILVNGGALPYEPDMEPLSKIVADFNRLWGENFTDPEIVAELIGRLPEQVSADEKYRNARQNSDRQNARIEHNEALRRQILNSLQCNTELYALFTANDEFRAWLEGEVFHSTYEG